MEHREHPRVPIELEVHYRRLNSFLADYTKNISKGGTFIKTKRPLPVGTRFLFRLKVPAGSDAFALVGELTGEVVRSDAVGADPGMAIRFAWEDESVRVAFERAVERLMADSLGPAVTAGLLGVAQRK